ncbi:MAG: hypothetical protein ACW99A_17480 [Candidatus Kariarchaeaceae archaeon]
MGGLTADLRNGVEYLSGERDGNGGIISFWIIALQALHTNGQ